MIATDEAGDTGTRAGSHDADGSHVVDTTDAADGSDRTDGTESREPSETDGPRSEAAGDLGREVGIEVGQEIVVGDLSTDDARVAAVRTDPTIRGAVDTALLYLAGWLHGINTGEHALLAALATEPCGACADTITRLAENPGTSAPGFSTEMTATFLGSAEPDADHAYTVVGFDVRLDSFHTSDVDGVQVMQMLEPVLTGFRFAVEPAADGWAIGGIAQQEWSGQY